MSAILLEAGFLAEVHRMHLRVLRGRPVQTMRLFHESNIYLTLLFAALAADALACALRRKVRAAGQTGNRGQSPGRRHPGPFGTQRTDGQ